MMNMEQYNGSNSYEYFFVQLQGNTYMERQWMHDNYSDLTAGGTSVIMCNALLYCKKCYSHYRISSKKFSPSNYSVPFTEWLNIVSNLSAKVVMHIFINGNGMHTQTEYWTLTSKNSAKLKQYYYFHAEFLEEIR